MSSSSSLRSRRVIVASLFLPNTVTLNDDGGSGNPTPDAISSPFPTPRKASMNTGTSTPGRDISMPEILRRLHDKTVDNPSLPKSIVDDLKDRATRKALGPNAMATINEALNPFSKAGSLPQTPPQKPSKHPSEDDTAQPPLTYRTPSVRRPKHTLSRSRSRRSFSSVAASELHVEANGHANGGLKNAIDSVSLNASRPMLKKKLWVGTLGVDTDSWSSNVRQGVHARLRDGYQSEIVWTPDDVLEKAYDEFCHQVLWPALHYAVPDAPKTKMFYESASFKHYVEVNQKFAEAIRNVWHEGDVVWVNDYHLMLLPQMLRQAGITGPIGFFMHVAFPSSEIFRCLSVREQLLRGVLGADLVGFQTASFARHFRQTCSRILAVEALPRGVQMPPEEGAATGDEESGHFVDVGVYPMGIDVGLFRERKRDPEVAEWLQVLKQRYAGMKIVVGRDKLDDIQGVKQKIQAFGTFLEQHPEYQGKVVLIQIAIPSNSAHTSATPAISSLTDKILADVSSINSRFSTLTYHPILFLPTSDVSFSQYVALLSCADAFIVTSLREGMALRTHEFVVSQEDKEPGKEGTLILSEFTGSWSFHGFRSCVGINPWDRVGTARGLFEALDESGADTPEKKQALMETRHRRWEELLGWVEEQSAQKFVSGFLSRCLRAWEEHQRGSGDRGNVELLDKTRVQRVAVQLRHCEKRLIVVDLEGSLWNRALKTQGSEMDVDNEDLAAAMNTLKQLSQDKKNEVWVLSGLKVKGALSKLAEEAPEVGIVAENGCFLKTRDTKGKPGTWINMVGSLNMDWKPMCIEMLNYFTERTPGSYVEEREASVVWRFWNGDAQDNCADRQWARRQAAEAQNHIFDSLGERYGLRIIPGSNSFLVLPSNISRSTAVGAILHPGGPGNAPVTGRTDFDSTGTWDFILAVSGDEKLLTRLNELDNAETCSTSGKGTDAKWRVERASALELLKVFVGV
ncbi:glycosyltransferase family 20 protein [Cylindrobasidium torrendii FP15055 ss-10]|uniref:Glycosyltransferase family 20 protein n=1 Tax=Cylindrobasidium torrendii FP15055 ss-10 TaxID=1314674 RepID=A0A0D7BIK1_9AGAR|nr:glycosyltransferase family 20 protein [Cylindrobasidium torrendii FP15055 ss-10]